MPIDLSSLSKDRREFEFEYGGMTMPVVYKPSVMTGRFAQEMADCETIDAFTSKLCEVIVDWDLMSNSRKLPVKPESVALLPTAMIRKMLADITEDAGMSEGKVVQTMNRASRRSKATSTASNGT
jgi:hypothetical protein